MKPSPFQATIPATPFWEAVQEALDLRRDPLEDPRILAMLMDRPQLFGELEDLLESLERLEGAPLTPLGSPSPLPQLGPALAAGLLALFLLPGLLKRGVPETDTRAAGRISHLMLTVNTHEGSHRIRFQADRPVEQTIERHHDLGAPFAFPSATSPSAASPAATSPSRVAPRGLSLSISTRTLEP